MKKSTIIGLSIFSVFLLCSLSYQPLIAEELNDNIRLKVYFCLADTYIEKGLNSGGGHTIHGCNPKWLYLDADLDGLTIDVVMNYSITMNYSYVFTRPIYFAPIFAFGIIVENYTQYEIKTIKMPNFGFHQIKGNISVQVEIDMSNVSSGDLIILKPSYLYFKRWNIDECNFNTPDNNTIKWAIIFRLLFNIPVIGEYLLHNWLIPKLEPYNKQPKQNDDAIGPRIWLYFN